MLKFITFLFLIIFIGCKEILKVNRTKVELIGFDDKTTVIFDRDDFQIYFGRNDLINFCEKSRMKIPHNKKRYTINTIKGDTVFYIRTGVFGIKEPDTIIFKGDTIDIANRIFKNTFHKLVDPTINIITTVDTMLEMPRQNLFLLTFLNDLKTDAIIVKDSVATKVDTVSKYLVDWSLGMVDTIVEIPDWDSKQTLYAEALRWAMISILREGKAKVYDVYRRKFADYIMIKDVEDIYGSHVQMSLPNGEMFYHATLWVY